MEFGPIRVYLPLALALSAFASALPPLTPVPVPFDFISNGGNFVSFSPTGATVSRFFMGPPAELHYGSPLGSSPALLETFDISAGTACYSSNCIGGPSTSLSTRSRISFCP